MSNNLNYPIDTDGNALTDATELGDIDMSSASMGDMRAYFVEYIESPETTRTTAYTGVSKDTALRDGKFILYRNQTQASGNWTLNLTLSDGTTTGAKPVYSSGTTNVGTMYKANSVIPMVYRTATNAWYASAGLTLADLEGKMAASATGADIAVSGTDSTKIDAALAGKASTADATLTDAATWACNPATDSNGQAYHVEWQDRGWAAAWFLCAGNDQNPVSLSYSTDASATRIEFTVSSGSVVATRAALQGYQLGSQTDKPLASEAEAEALRQGKQNALSAQQLANIAAVPSKVDINVIAFPFDDEGGITYDVGDIVSYGERFWICIASYTPQQGASKPDVDNTHWQDCMPCDEISSLSRGKANRAANPTAGNLAALDASGNPTDSGMSKSAVESLLFAQYYPDGSVKSAAEFTSGIKYDSPDTTNRTITVKPFCITDDQANDNSGLVGRVVIPPFVDASGSPYISDDGTRFKVVGVSGGRADDYNYILTAIVAPNTVTTIGPQVFDHCDEITSVSLPAVTGIGNSAFYYCSALASVSLPAATTIEAGAFSSCGSLSSVSLPAATTIGAGAFFNCASLTTIDFGDMPRSDVPTLGSGAFEGVPTTCTIIVPYTQYNDWKAASGWSALTQEFVRHSEKADKPATFTTGNLAKFDANGNPTDSGKKAGDFADTSALAPLWVASETYDAGNTRSYNGKVYECILAVNPASATTPDNDTTHWKVTDMTSPDATLDITADARLRVMSAEGQELWSQGYALAGESAVTLSCDKVNYYAFASGTVTQAFAMPRAATGKVGDFVLDIDNSANAAADATATLTGWNTVFDIYTTEGEVLSDLLTFAGGEKCELYFSLTAFGTTAKPAWKISKVVVEKQEAGE